MLMERQKIQIEIKTEHIELLETLKQEYGVQSRSRVFEMLLDDLLNPDSRNPEPYTLAQQPQRRFAVSEGSSGSIGITALTVSSIFGWTTRYTRCLLPLEDGNIPAN